MANYRVKLSSVPKAPKAPPLLREFGAWLARRPHGSLGWFDALETQAIPDAWDPSNAARLRKEAFAFLSLPDGSLLALLRIGADKPLAVVLLGSEGDRRTVASSLEDLLVQWARGETEIDELDDADGAAGRKALAAWLKEHKVRASKSKPFDFQAWLDGAPAKRAAAPAATATPARAPTALAAKLGPTLRELASLMGRRADDPAVVAFVTKRLGKKVPAGTSERNESANVEAPKKGLELLFSHDIKNEAYPPIRVTAQSFAPYLQLAWVRAEVAESVLGAPWNATDETAVIAALGPPTGRRPEFMTDNKETVPYWRHELDAAAGVELLVEFWRRLRVTMQVRAARDLSKTGDVTEGLFVAWAARRGLLDVGRFTAHADLLARVKAGKAKGSELVAAALTRGLWDDHLRDLPKLRRTAYQYFHNMNKIWITADLKKVFGKRPGPGGHDQPKVDDDSVDAVDKAAKIFDQRFAAWL
ncbi:MAG: hypothetical protein KBG28_14545 [Kofleriaceae bacterium]|nr:hypothetical protein [Kofleriaceae bacterium]